MSGGAEDENIGDFYARLLITFDYERQLSKINDQLQSFSKALTRITVPVIIDPYYSPNSQRWRDITERPLRITGPKSIEGPTEYAEWYYAKNISGPNLEGSPSIEDEEFSSATGGGGRKGGGGSNNGSFYSYGQSRPDKEYGINPGYGKTSGDGHLGFFSQMLGMGTSMAAFTGAFAVIGDLVQGAHLDRQLAILQAIIPNQQEYNNVLANLEVTANQTGLALQPLMHTFTSFAMSAKLSGVSMQQAVVAYDSIATAISGSGSQAQGNRIISDITHLFLNSQKVSLSRLGRTDPGTYLKMVQLIMQESQFKGMDEEEVSKKLSGMDTQQRMVVMETALKPWSQLASAGQNTLAGRFTAFENTLQILGGTLVTIVTPALKVFLDVITLMAAQINAALQNIIHLGSFLKGVGSEAISNIENFKQQNHLTGLETFKYLFHGGENPGSKSSQQTVNVNVAVQDKTTSGVRASVSKPNPHQSQTFARTI